MKTNNIPNKWQQLQTALIAVLIFGCAGASAREPNASIASENTSSAIQPPLHLQPTSSALLEMIKKLAELPLEDLQNAEKTIAISQLPFREIVERNGQHGVERFFNLTELGAPIRFGTYWYRKPLLPDRAHVYFSVSLDSTQFCLNRYHIEYVFGNVWLTGFRNDRMPGAIPRIINLEEHHFGAMTYLLKDGRLLNFGFNLNQSDCVANFSLNLGKDK